MIKSKRFAGKFVVMTHLSEMLKYKYYAKKYLNNQYVFSFTTYIIYEFFGGNDIGQFGLF